MTTEGCMNFILYFSRFLREKQHLQNTTQTRDWSDDAYDVGMYFVREAKAGTPASVTAGLSRYYAITIDRLIFLFREVGFTDVQRLDGVLHQPIIVGRRSTN
jgi:alkanesulfonate monooxygenase SsuD/methylene tetrahydromethanopterin reductase-like flavin-dependent oxidoreductase (luciferase family)